MLVSAPIDTLNIGSIKQNECTVGSINQRDLTISLNNVVECGNVIETNVSRVTTPTENCLLYFPFYFFFSLPLKVLTLFNCFVLPWAQNPPCTPSPFSCFSLNRKSFKVCKNAILYIFSPLPQSRVTAKVNSR